MAGRGNVRVSIKSTFDDKGVKQAEGSLGRLNKAGSHAFAGVTKEALGYGAALIGGAGVVGGLEAVVHASIDAEASQAKVQKAVANAGLSWTTYKDRINTAIERQSIMSGFAKTDLQDAFANMVRTTGNVNEALKLNAVAMDIARTKGTGLVQAQSILARVYNGSFIGLKRLGIGIEPVTTAQDKLRESTKKATIEQTRAAKAEDKRATVQKALALTQQKFAGQAQTYGKTTAGSLDRIKESVNLLEVRLGKALTPAIRDGANALSKFILQIQNGDGRAGRFAKAIQDLIERLRPLEPLLKALAKGLGILFDAFTLQIKVIARIEGALVSLYRVIVDKVLGAFSSMLDGISAAAKAASHIPIIGEKFKGVADAAHSAADKINGVRDKLRILDGQSATVSINLQEYFSDATSGGGGGFGGVNRPAPSKHRPRAGGASVHAPTAGGGVTGHTSSAGGPMASASSAGPTAHASRMFSHGELMQLWVAAGGPPAQADMAAAIAQAESGGNASIVNSIGATGLWQIHPGGSQYLDPMANARAAVAKYQDSLRRTGNGWLPWTTYTGYDTPGHRPTYAGFLTGARAPSGGGGGGGGGTAARPAPKPKTPYDKLQNSLGYLGLEVDAGVLTQTQGDNAIIRAVNKALPNLTGSNKLRAMANKRQAQQDLRSLRPKPIKPVKQGYDHTIDNPWLQAYLAHQDYRVASGEITQAEGNAIKAQTLTNALPGLRSEADKTTALGMIADLQPQPTIPGYDKAQADLALAGLTKTTGDDLAALNTLKDIDTGQLNDAVAKGDNAGIVQWANELKGVQDSIDNLDSTIDNTNALLQQQIDVEKERSAQLERALAVAQSEERTLGRSLANQLGLTFGIRAGMGKLLPTVGASQ